LGGVAERLRPGVLDDLGLVRAITALARRVSDTTDLPVESRVGADVPRLDAEAELGVYRVAQEALTNAARHSGGTRACVELRRSEGGGLLLRVSDDGSGMDGAPAGGGLTGMRERAMLLGATLTIEDRAAGGVEVTFEVPGAGAAPKAEAPQESA
jgi:two-component system sensor histidine kinase UhpB